MDPALQEINQKLDVLTAQIAYLSEQSRLNAQSREATAELVETAVPIARNALTMVADEMEEIQQYVEIADLVRILKKLARHLPQIEMLLDQLDSLSDLLEILGPILKEGMNKATDVMGDLERKGYVGFAEGGLKLMDNVVTSFSREDVDRLGDNVVLILNLVKAMTQPEIMNFVRDTLQVAQREVEKPVDTGLVSLLGQIKDPAVRRGLALTMRVLKVVGEQAAPKSV
jgi:uncharacterized protein YjgD (DUF1641 family)